MRDTGVWIDSGDIVMDLPVVLRVGSHLEQASETVRQAIVLYAQKGNLVSAAKAKHVLAELVSEIETAP
jgi:hypothetical protein